MMKSIFKSRIDDPRAIYLYPEKNRNDTAALQDAINLAAKKLGAGIVFLAPGTYTINDTVYVPGAIRLIGYGADRPVIKLEDDCAAFKKIDPEDKGQAKYMFWYTGRPYEVGKEVFDANSGTFYSAFQNININVGKENPNAVALRTHYAQHCFVSYSEICIDSGKAGIFDTGNVIDHVEFIGGDYGIYTTRSSPSWQFTMSDVAFEGQRKSAVRTQEAGITITNAVFKNSTVGIETSEGFCEKLYIENSVFENVKTTLIIDNELSSYSQYHMENIKCAGVENIASYRSGRPSVKAVEEKFKINDFTNGYSVGCPGAEPVYISELKTEPLKRIAAYNNSGLKKLPSVENWINVRTLGIYGDGTTDVTETLQAAVDKYDVLYLPQGRYIISDTVKLRENTVLIGLHPIMTQIEIKDNTPSFSFLGTPKPLVLTPENGTNIISGLGINAGGINQRAVGIKWQSGASSMLNDVKFVGGHGSYSKDGEREGAYNRSHTADIDEARKWDSMYPSLWITGGGCFYDIWSASPYASAGIYVSDTDIPGVFYEISVEHHVRAEVRFKNVKNWKILSLQLEEERCESSYCQPLELINCENIKFANFYAFRVIWHVNPWPYAVLEWNCRNVVFYGFHNFTQVKLTIDNSVLDVNNNAEVRPWELAKLVISGKSERKLKFDKYEIANGFEFADGICADSKGNIYFADDHRKRIYKWNAADERIELLYDTHYKPLSLAVDTEDKLLVVTEYEPQRGMIVNGKPERYPAPEDSRGTDYGKWYSMLGNDIQVYAIDPSDPDHTMTVLDKVKMADIKPLRTYYPVNRWRNNNDWLSITVKKNEECFVAPDGLTVIPDIYDLMRANSLSAAEPGKRYFCSDEYYKRTYSFITDEHGWLSEPELFAEKGEQGMAVTDDGRIIIADGEIYIYSPEGELLKTVYLPKRAAALIAVGNYLYVTARSSFYKIKLD